MASRRPCSFAASVIAQTLVPSFNLYAERRREPSIKLWSLAWRSSWHSSSPQSPAKCLFKKLEGHLAVLLKCLRGSRCGQENAGLKLRFGGGGVHFLSPIGCVQ